MDTQFTHRHSATLDGYLKDHRATNPTKGEAIGCDHQGRTTALTRIHIRPGGKPKGTLEGRDLWTCLLYTSPSPRD